MYFARSLTTKIRATTKIVEITIESNWVITGFAKELDTDVAICSVPFATSVSTCEVTLSFEMPKKLLSVIKDGIFCHTASTAEVALPAAFSATPSTVFTTIGSNILS